MYNMDMRGEGGSVLIEPGWNVHRVTNIDMQTSKSGNEMFAITLEHPSSGSVNTVYAITIKGKRWLLKQFLSACGIIEAEDGNYKWCEEDVLGCSVDAYNVQEDNEFTRRDGTVVKEKRNKINGFRKATVKVSV